MHARILSAALGAALLLAPATFAQRKKASESSNMSKDMQEAIAWEHHKDAAAARQARMEARHPSVTYNSANRSSDEEYQGRKVKDEKAPGSKRDRQ